MTPPTSAASVYISFSRFISGPFDHGKQITSSSSPSDNWSKVDKFPSRWWDITSKRPKNNMLWGHCDLDLWIFEDISFTHFQICLHTHILNTDLQIHVHIYKSNYTKMDLDSHLSIATIMAHTNPVHLFISGDAVRGQPLFLSPIWSLQSHYVQQCL